MRRFSLPSYPKQEIDLSSVHQNLTSLKSDSGKPDITLVTASGQRYTVPRSRLEAIPMFKDLLEASVNVEKEDIPLPENCSDESLKLLFDLLEGKLLDPISLQAFDELFLLADFLGFDDLQKALSASLADQFKNADMQQKINLAPLLAEWQGLGNFIAQETVDKILYDCIGINNYSIHKPWLQAILDSLKSMMNEDLPAYTPGLHPVELLRFCGVYGMEVDKQLLVPDSDLSRCSSYYQAICHEWGIGTPKDMELAFKQYQLAAKQKDPRAQRALEACFDDGLGTSKNPGLAFYWYRLASEQGDAVAQIYLGNCYYSGIGTPKDTKEAQKWYQRAADQGHAVAQTALGNCYCRGIGTPLDLTLAVEWYRRAADQGHAEAQTALGDCYYWGIGTPKDIKEALKWYQRAADQGFEPAKQSIRDKF